MNREEAAAVLDAMIFGTYPDDDITIEKIEMEAVRFAIAALRSPWVKTSDRLPEPWVTVLLWNGGEMVSGFAVDDGDLIEHRWGLVFRATHWMLPEPPGEEVEG